MDIAAARQRSLKRGTVLIIRIPEEKGERLKTLAKSRNVSVNKLIEEMASVMLAEFDAETRFQLRAARGHGKQKRSLELLRRAAGKACPVRKA